MSPFISYLLRSAITLAVFYFFYVAFLRKETFFRFNRYYFLGSVVLSLLIPLVDISRLLPGGDPAPVQVISRSYINFEQVLIPAPPVSSAVSSGPDVSHLLLWIYLAVAGVLLLRIVVQGLRLFLRIRRSPVIRRDGVKIVADRHVKSPFSFFSWVFVHPEQLVEPNIGEVILHEKEHIRQHHTWDLLLMELFSVIQWPNPFVWLMNRAMKETHEYLADRAVLAQGIPAGDYQRTLIGFVLGGGNAALITPLNFSLNHKRILMMKKMRSPNSKKWWSLLLLPVILILVFAFSNPPVEKNSHPTFPEQKEKYVLTGHVIDSKTGDPVPGINIYLPGKGTGTVSDVHGRFMLAAESRKSKVVFEQRGYLKQELLLKIGKDNEVRMERLEGTLPPPPSNPDGETGTMGRPVLYILNGKEISNEEMKNISSEDIRKIDVIKGDKAVKLYGEKARNGVIILTLKQQGEYKLKGKVIDDATGQPKQGVSVVVVNTTRGTMTGPSGKFVLIMDKPEEEVAFSFVGYETVKKKLKAGEDAVIRLKKGIIRLDLNEVPVQRESSSQPVTVNGKEEIFYVVEDVPHYPGGMPALKKYISSHLKYPEKLKKKGIGGTVWVNFTVDEQGRVKDVYVDKVHSIDPQLDKEAVRVISSLPAWTPGKQRGRSVPVELSVPVEFK